MKHNLGGNIENQVRFAGRPQLVAIKRIIAVLVACVALTSCSYQSGLNANSSEKVKVTKEPTSVDFQVTSQQLLESDLRKSVQSNLIYESETFSGNTNLTFTLSDQNIQEPEFRFANFRGEIELWVICIGDGTIEYSLESVGSEIGVLPQDCKNEMNWQSIGMKIKTPVEEIKISTKLSGNPETYRFAISYSNN